MTIDLSGCRPLESIITEKKTSGLVESTKKIRPGPSDYGDYTWLEPAEKSKAWHRKSEDQAQPVSWMKVDLSMCRPLVRITMEKKTSGLAESVEISYTRHGKSGDYAWPKPAEKVRTSTERVKTRPSSSLGNENCPEHVQSSSQHYYHRGYCRLSEFWNLNKREKNINIILTNF